MKDLLGRRFHRLFANDGKSVIVAMDHGSTDGLVKGFEHPEQLLDRFWQDSPTAF